MAQTRSTANQAKKRLAAAKRELRRIERVIAPYVQPEPLEAKPPRGEWTPGDHVAAEPRPRAA